MPGRIISNWLLCFFCDGASLLCGDSVCLGRRLHSRERDKRGATRERREKGAGHVAPCEPVLVASLYGINTFDAFEGA